jgi:NAD(P)-dependent dehydrogenase (short-subunit alcohol dehydrogenase family)
MASDSVLRLNDKTIVISAPFSILTCSLMTTLTEFGANCALICPDANEANRFCENLSNAVEAKESHGRATAIQANIQSPSEGIDAISRSAEIFGGVDVFVDGHYDAGVGRLLSQDFAKNGEALVRQTILATMMMTQGAITFLQGRTKGRIIYFVPSETLSSIPGESTNTLLRAGVSAFAKCLSHELLDKHIQVNCISVGITEEFLLKRYPKSPSIKIALDEFQKIMPTARIQDSMDIANAVAFLASPLSAAFPGRTF